MKTLSIQALPEKIHPELLQEELRQKFPDAQVRYVGPRTVTIGPGPDDWVQIPEKLEVLGAALADSEVAKIVAEHAPEKTEAEERADQEIAALDAKLRLCPVIQELLGKKP